jgi:hypothetical protein
MKIVKKMNWVMQVFLNGWGGITFFPLGIFLSPNTLELEKTQPIVYKKMVNHEMIHWKQQKEMVLIGLCLSIIAIIVLLLCKVNLIWFILTAIYPFTLFYTWYFLEWLTKLVTPPIGAYKDISFEREAHMNDVNLEYLKIRKYFAWLKYIKR